VESQSILESKSAKKDYNKAWLEKVRGDEKLRLALKSKKQWNYIKRRIDEDGDAIGADEFRTPDGLIYYAAGMLVLIKAIRDHKEFMRERDKLIRRRKYAERIKNPEWLDRRRKRTNAYQKKMRAESAHHKIAGVLRIRLCNVVRCHGGKKLTSTVALLGCSIEDLKLHLESQFKPGMTWENYGRKKGIQCWEIDHILPCASFDLTDPEQQKRCFNYTNLQPLWAKDNQSKSSSLPANPACL
jgi:hypothetical protein